MLDDNLKKYQNILKEQVLQLGDKTVELTNSINKLQREKYKEQEILKELEKEKFIKINEALVGVQKIYKDKELEFQGKNEYLCNLLNTFKDVEKSVQESIKIDLEILNIFPKFEGNLEEFKKTCEDLIKKTFSTFLILEDKVKLFDEGIDGIQKTKDILQKQNKFIDEYLENILNNVKEKEEQIEKDKHIVLLEKT